MFCIKLRRSKKVRSQKKPRVLGEWDVYSDPVSEITFFHNFVSDVFSLDKPAFKSATDKERGESSEAPDEGWEHEY